MADENNTGSNTEMADTNSLAKTPAPKMPRAPRRPKAAAEATVATQVGKTGKAPRGRRKRREQTADTKSASVGTQVADIAVQDVATDPVRERMSQQPEQAVTAPASARDEMADLIKLEEENKRLRKLLAEKLRAENADLRKRLGLD
ncbi:SyrB-like regulator [Rhizobium calliandrae]|uniref:SyrB-like regulator n=2 Tax=Rhizobium calliandrae TaxID=1312182 RepID=A0ABT7KI27_9HYPH|nr:SyrB-like regulator [Rhizobium calliandrae]MDL2408285.1 SyrB-like regulator [Rhizobium calliandrae]